MICPSAAPPLRVFVVAVSAAISNSAAVPQLTSPSRYLHIYTHISDDCLTNNAPVLRGQWLVYSWNTAGDCAMDPDLTASKTTQTQTTEKCVYLV